MGTFIGHFVPAFALILLGLWHAINTIRAYCLRGSANFTVKFWYPFYGSLSRLKYLELIFILSFSVFAILVQLLDYPMFHFAFKLSNFEHATMFLHLGIFACFTLSAEIAGSSNILSGVSGILVASVFGQELFLLRFHSTDHVGLEGHYHWLLQLIVFVSLVSALAATSVQSSFPFALVLAISVVFQGCWFMIMGFVLWIPEFIPEGCVTQMSDEMLGAVTCTSVDADLRARALANLQFSWILAGILLFTGCVCLKLTRRCSAGGNSYEYEKIQNVSIAIDGLKPGHA
ncbi:uncharacterized protein [Euphorbia lathyris]|uniref:uncharacterized protein n=1 Tax=Euphorbia lathyris TaxID=212925 RepID=UPI0033134878